MKLTEENKKYIDSLSLYGLLERWRFAKIGDPWFQDETGKYWGTRISKLRNENPDDWVETSKAVGW